jgi:hypothetical protein
MTWLSKEGRILDNETLLHLHTEIRNERRFWFDKSVAYVNFYSTVVSALLSAFILGLTQLSKLGQFKYVSLFIPIVSTILCIYAKKAIRVCYRQFLENTAIMAKLEFIIGMYSPIKLDIADKILFPGDNYINPIRHYEHLIRFKESEKFVEDDLSQPNRTFRIKTRVFSILETLSIIMLIGASILMILGEL